MVVETLADKIIHKLNQATGLYHRLVLLVGMGEKEKTAVMKEVARLTDTFTINVNLEMSRRMLALTERQRVLKTPRLLEEIVAESGKDTVILDNIEILFDVSLKQDPIRLLQKVARNRTVLSSWSGSIENGYLLYAAPGHQEYRSYSVADLLVVNNEKENMRIISMFAREIE